jgi:hypothetical protein
VAEAKDKGKSGVGERGWCATNDRMPLADHAEDLPPHPPTASRDAEKNPFSLLQTQNLFAIGGPVGPINLDFLSSKMRLLASYYFLQGENAKAFQLVRQADELLHL